MSVPGKDSRKELGRRGERQAEAFLTMQNYRIVHRNWKCRTGELDIVAWDGTVLVFVEVRTRRMTGTFGSPQESVNARKQKQVRDTAQVYLHIHQLNEASVRFDVVSVYMDLQGRTKRLEHLRGAF
jgi:putative endonuclease|nr:YraN family protein [Aneurinibacillus sp. XH2]